MSSSSVLETGVAVPSELAKLAQNTNNESTTLDTSPQSNLDRLARSFSIFWLDGKFAGHVEANGDFAPHGLNERDGPVFDFWSQRIGSIESNRFRPI